MRAIFIRHGESTANTGLASADVASIALTQRGEGEASRIAQEWSEVPSLIVTWPLCIIRTQIHGSRSAAAAIQVGVRT